MAQCSTQIHIKTTLHTPKEMMLRSVRTKPLRSSGRMLTSDGGRIRSSNFSMSCTQLSRHTCSFSGCASVCVCVCVCVCVQMSTKLHPCAETFVTDSVAACPCWQDKCKGCANYPQNTHFGQGHCFFTPFEREAHTWTQRTHTGQGKLHIFA